MTTIVSLLDYSPQQVIGKSFDLDPAALFSEENKGIFQIGGAIVHMQIHLKDEDRLLLVMADLGPLPVNQRNEHYQRMLIANSGWSDLAGGTLCTNDSGDRALLRLRLDLNTLNSESLGEWIKAFAVSAEEWARRIAPVSSGTDAPDAEARFAQPQEVHDLFLFNRA